MRGHGKLVGLRGPALTQAIRSVACPRCSAAPGAPCVKHGVPLPIECLARMDRARSEATS